MVAPNYFVWIFLIEKQYTRVYLSAAIQNLLAAHKSKRLVFGLEWPWRIDANITPRWQVKSQAPLGLYCHQLCIADTFLCSICPVGHLKSRAFKLMAVKCEKDTEAANSKNQGEVWPSLFFSLLTITLLFYKEGTSNNSN